MSTREWPIPKIEGVHMVARHGDTYALQFPDGCEDEVLAYLKQWISDLESGSDQLIVDRADEPAEVQNPDNPSLIVAPSRNRNNGPKTAPRHPNPHSPKRTHPGAAGQFAGDTIPAARPRLGRAHALSIAMGGSGAPAGAASAGQPSLRRPQGQSGPRGTVIANQPMGIKLSQEQLNAWNAQQSEGMSIFQELRRTRKPTEKAVTPEEVNEILRRRIESRGIRFMNSPEDTPGALETSDSTADDAPVVDGEFEEETAEINGVVEVKTLDPARVRSPLMTSQPSRAALATLEGPQAAEGPLTPDRTPLNTPERRWANQEAERQAIGREMKAKWPGVTVTRLMVQQEQEVRAAARGETLIGTVVPGAKGGLVEALGVGPESAAAPTVTTVQAAPPAAVQSPQERVVLGDVMHVPPGMEEQARGPAYPVPGKPALVPIAPVQSGPMAPAAVQNGEGAKPS